MKKITYFLFAFIAVLSLNSCEDTVEPLGTNYITFGEDSYSTGVDVGGSTSVDIPVYSANLSGSDRSFAVSVDAASNAAAGSYTVPTSVTIPAGENEGTLTVALTDTNLGIGVNNLIINFGIEEGLSNGGSTTLSYIQNCTEVTATLDIAFDNWGSESSWTITDSLGGVVASKARGTYSDGQASASETITLCSGRDYTFTFNDSFGDGLSDPSNGTVTLSIGGTTKATVTGNFGTKFEQAFDTK
ncbi:hypothetical protein [Polaribacter aestuariivivens]|uniref:hypothetical protein n=1 Tax=Polaribacter aestuariivivens TaxID=2304626 RepID=UPI003F498E33